MQSSFYQLPLRLDEIIRKKRHAVCHLKHSIAQNLHLIISTYRGESAFSDEFGCSLWDEEFNIQLNLRWKETLIELLKQTIAKFEKRLQVQEVKVAMEELHEWAGKENLRVRRCLNIEIKGIIVKTNELFHFRGMIYISPLAQK
jgi:phage baseplate assembly protein W